MKTMAERFWGYVDKNGPTPASCRGFGNCWLWTGFKDYQGYGRFTVATKDRRTATRVIWFLIHGAWPTHNILHRCDNPSCVNPDHLFDGTNSDNRYDSDAKKLGGVQIP